MSAENGEWIYEFMDKKEADRIDARLENIEENNKTIITMMMSATKEDVIDLCHTWDQAVRGDMISWLRVSSFLEHVISHMREHLDKGDE